jgi:hypothetical protein
MSDENSRQSEAAEGDQARTFFLMRADAREVLAFVGTAIALVTSLLWIALETVVAIFACTLFLLAVGLLYKLLRKRVVVGVDGILIRDLMSRRLVRYDEIASVDQVQDTKKSDDGHRPVWSTFFGVRVGLAGGASIDLTTSHHSSFEEGDTGPGDPVGDALVIAIQRRRNAWTAREGHAHEDALARGGQTGAAWIDALRRLTEGTAGAYRRAIPVDRLWALLDDTDARPVTRTAAAVALYRFDDARARQRLRIAARSLADPETRGGLERVANAVDDAALAAALDTLHDDDARSERVPEEPLKKQRTVP